MGGPDMAPQTPQTFEAARHSRAASLSPRTLGPPLDPVAVLDKASAMLAR